MIKHNRLLLLLSAIILYACAPRTKTYEIGPKIGPSDAEVKPQTEKEYISPELQLLRLIAADSLARALDTAYWAGKYQTERSLFHGQLADADAEYRKGNILFSGWATSRNRIAAAIFEMKAFGRYSEAKNRFDHAEIKTLIEGNQIEAALDRLIGADILTAYLIKGRYTRLNVAKQAGLLTKEEENIEKNRIKYSIFSLIE